MSDYASITVQFKPFVLQLTRWSDGQWIAYLGRLNDDPGAPPIVAAHSNLFDAQDGARVTLDEDTPRLRVGRTRFSVPKKQLLRLRDWIDQQNRPVVAGPAEEAQP